MATAKHGKNSGRGLWAKALLVLFMIGSGLVWFYGGNISAQAQAATSYGARYACSCRYLGGRDLNSCQGDFVPGMGLVFLSDDDEDKTVTAYVPLVASNTARHREGFGCMLDSWEE